jgi:N utilization substance protein B
MSEGRPPAGQGEHHGSPGHRQGGRRRGGRREARRTAVQILYQADVTGASAAEVIRQWREAGRTIRPYTDEVVEGVESALAEIDGNLEEHSEGWPVHRMAVVDRTILRVACWELSAGVPVAVAVDEAVETANELSTDDSGRFINGLLGRIARGIEAEEQGLDR